MEFLEVNISVNQRKFDFTTGTDSGFRIIKRRLIMLTTDHVLDNIPDEVTIT